MTDPAGERIVLEFRELAADTPVPVRVRHLLKRLALLSTGMRPGARLARFVS